MSRILVSIKPEYGYRAIKLVHTTAEFSYNLPVWTSLYIVLVWQEHRIVRAELWTVDSTCTGPDIHNIQSGFRLKSKKFTFRCSVGSCDVTNVRERCRDACSLSLSLKEIYIPMLGRVLWRHERAKEKAKCVQCLLTLSVSPSKKFTFGCSVGSCDVTSVREMVRCTGRTLSFSLSLKEIYIQIMLDSPVKSRTCDRDGEVHSLSPPLSYISGSQPESISVDYDARSQVIDVQVIRGVKWSGCDVVASWEPLG